MNETEALIRLEAAAGWIEHARNGDCPVVDVIDAVRLLIDVAERILQDAA